MAKKSKTKAKTKTQKTPKRQDLEGSRVKIKFRKHILPPLVGLIVFLLVFGFFNAEYLSGRIAYYLYQRKANVSNLDTSLATKPVDKNAPAKIVINKINVNAPVNFSETQINEAVFLQDLQHGVVHYPNTAFPGQTGNVVIFGHSSGAWWAPGDYKFVFTLLDKLKIGDKIFVEYQGTRYTYQVDNTKVVDPTDISVLNQDDSHSLTLITCTPVGTSAKRLIVHAKQTAPLPVKASNEAETSLPSDAQGTLPGNSSSFWHNLRELF